MSTTGSDYTFDATVFQGTISGNSSTWRTLTKDEWTYVMNVDNSSSYRQITVGDETKKPYGHATVMGQTGLILLPDDWDGTVDPNFTYGKSYDWPNNYTEETTVKWSDMEAAGAVFFPAAGYRYGGESTLYSVDTYGFYWSSTATTSSRAWEATFSTGSLKVGYGYYILGYSVRLVNEVTE